MSEGRGRLFRTGGSVLVILAALVFFRSFLPPEAAKEAPYVVRDSAGVEIVESSEPIWSGEEGWVVGAQPLRRIGDLNGEEPYQFTEITGVGLLPGGRVVVGDGGSQEIRFFDAEGRHLRTVGRSGEGPGEFLGLAVTGAGPGGTVWAYDFSLRRLTWFDDEGELIRVVSLAMDPPTLNAVGPLPDGSFLLKQLWGARQVSEGSLEGFRRDPVAWVIFDEGGALVDSVGTFPGRELVITEEDGRGVMNTPPFARSSVGTIRGDRVVVGDQERFEFSELDLSGHLRRILRIPGRVEEVTAGDLADYIQNRLAAVPPDRQPSVRQSLQDMPRPETRPAYGPVLSDAAGNLWAGEWTHGSEPPAAWTVFDREGAWLGEVRMPRRFHPWVIGEDWILGVEQDELDVEYVALYPLEGR